MTRSPPFYDDGVDYQERDKVDPEILRDAVRAVQARNLGRDQVAVRAALDEELANRGITQDPLTVDAVARILAAAQGPHASFHVSRELLKLGAEAVSGLRGLLHELRANADPDVPHWLKPPEGHEVERSTRAEFVEVDLADGMQPFLTKAFNASVDPKWADEEELVSCELWIDTRRPPTPGAPIPVILGQESIGTIDAEDALTLDGDLRKAEGKKQPLILDGTIEREQDGLSVYVRVP